MKSAKDAGLAYFIIHGWDVNIIQRIETIVMEQQVRNMIYFVDLLKYMMYPMKGWIHQCNIHDKADKAKIAKVGQQRFNQLMSSHRFKQKK